MSKVISIGVIGCGGISQMMHLPFLLERPDLFKVVALSDRDKDVLESVGKRYHVDDLYTDYKEMLNKPFDAVLIASSGSHRQPVIDSALAGKHIMVEKPLGENMAEVQAIAEVVEKSGVILMVGYHKRYDPGYQFAAQAVKGLKDLRLVRCEVLHPVDARARDHYYLYPQKTLEQKAMEDDEERDGLVSYVCEGDGKANVEAIVGRDAKVEQKVATFLLFNSLIHDINALRGILGEPDDCLFAEFWRGGRVMHVVLSWGDKIRGTLSWVYLPGLRHYKEELLFLSPESRVTLTFPSPYFKHFPTPVRIESMNEGRFEERYIIVSLEEAFRNELLHFYHCVTEKQTPITDIKDAIGDTIILEKIARTYK